MTSNGVDPSRAQLEKRHEATLAAQFIDKAISTETHMGNVHYPRAIGFLSRRTLQQVRDTKQNVHMTDASLHRIAWHAIGQKLCSENSYVQCFCFGTSCTAFQ